MADLTLFEHERKRFDWSEQDAVGLDRINRAARSTILEAQRHKGQRVLKAAAHVGVVRFGPHTVQVLPKIDFGDDRTGSATRNLLHMLELAGNLPLRDQAVAPLLQQGKDWFEILTRLFAANLIKTWQQGPFSAYHSVERTQPALKGRLRLQSQLQRPGRDHLFDVTFDEFSVDNRLNRVLRYVVERLWRLTRDATNRRLLDELRAWLEPVRLLPAMSAADAPPTLINRLNRRFEPLLNLARLFLDQTTLQLASGAEQAYAFVFDMNRLFEEYVIAIIRSNKQQILPAALADSTLHPQSRGQTRTLARSDDGRRLFRLKPDLACRMGDVFPLLIDTKYKRLQSARDVSQSDFYQMFAYAHRYRCPRVLLIYPQSELQLHQSLSLNDMPGYRIGVATVNLHVDLSRSRGRQRLIDELREIFETMIEENNAK